MTFTALAIVYLVVCAGLGLRREPRGSSIRLSMGLAAAMVCVQLVLLLRL